MSEPMTIVIADDHPIFRQGLRQLLEREPIFAVVGDVGDGTSALEAIERLRPRLAVLDIDMPGMDGLAVAGAVRERRLPTAIVCLTMHKDARFLNTALNAGVMGYVLKDGALVEIVEALKSVAAGRHYVSPQLRATSSPGTRRPAPWPRRRRESKRSAKPSARCCDSWPSSRLRRRSRRRSRSVRARWTGTGRIWPKNSV